MKPFKELFKGIWSNRISILGVAITTVSAIIIIIAVLLSFFNIEFTPYQNLIVFGFFSMLFILGLLMIPIGAWFWRRRTSREVQSIEPLMIDFSNPLHVRGLVFFLIMTLLNVIIFSVVFYKSYHFTESNTFCGKICHSVMSPEYIAHSRSSHSRVKCADCHIGSGAQWFVKAKISGIWQVIAVLTNSYSRPIPSPVDDLRPARDTCEQCHWPQVFHGKRLKIYERLDNDVKVDDPRVTALAVNVGGQNKKSGKYEGIHWHVGDQNIVEYMAVDKKRLKIRNIRVTDGKAKKVTEYINDKIEEPKGDKIWRTMDCIDCHNRPTHVYDVPEDAIDKEIFHDNISASLPGVRKLSIEILKGEYKSQDDAEKMITELFRAHYAKNHTDISVSKKKEIDKAAAAIVTIYKFNVFPNMNIKFGTYPNHIGHRDAGAGCFRCHDENHKSKDGNVISQDCDQCHTIVVEDTKLSKIPKNAREILNLR